MHRKCVDKDVEEDDRINNMTGRDIHREHVTKAVLRKWRKRACNIKKNEVMENFSELILFER